MWKKLLCVLMVLPALAFAGEIKDHKVLYRLWNDMKEANVKAIKKYTSPSFQAVRYNGAQNRAQELQIIANLHMTGYTLTNIVVTKNRHVLVFTYNAATTETVSGQVMSDTPTQRITVFERKEGKWIWVSHASFAQPLI